MVDISAAGRGSSGGQIMKEEPLLFPWLMDNVQLPAGSTPAPRDFMEVSEMPDREKVIKGLELVKQDIHEIFVSGSQIAVDCLRIDNAIALLTEQENASKRNPVIVCPHCGKRVK